MGAHRFRRGTAPWLAGAASLVLLMMSAAVAHAAAHRVMVVAIPNKARPDFVSQVVGHVIHPLGERVAQVPGPDAHNAMVKSGLQRPSLHNPRNAQKVGRLARASHILVVEAQGAGRKQSVHAFLVDVATGKVVMTSQQPMPGGAFTPPMGARIVKPVFAKLGANRPLVAAAPPPPPPRPAPTPPPTPPPAPEEAAEEAEPEPAKPAKAAKKARHDDSEDDEADDEREERDDDKRADDKRDEAAEEKDDAPSDGHKPRWRSPARLAAGAEFMQRQGQLTGNMPAGVTRLPGYMGDKTNSNPFFPLAHLGVEFFPLAIGGTGRALEGLGVRVDLDVSYIKSVLSDPNSAGRNSVVSSTVFGLKAAAAYRYVLWNSALATDVELDVGLRYLGFPLGKGQFPGVAYTAPMVGLRVNIPLATEHLALVARGALEFAMQAGGDAPKSLSATQQQTSGMGYEIGGGLRIGYRRLEVTALMRYEMLTAAFAGSAALPGIPSRYQPSNVTLADRYLGILVTVGWVF